MLQSQQEMQNLLPTDMSLVAALLKDMGSANSCAQTAHEFKIGILDQREDQINASQKDFKETAIAIVRGAEADRIRKRVLEMNEWYKNEVDYIKNVE